MKKNIRTMVYLMIVVVVAGGVFLWSQGKSNEEALGNLDPESFDVETTCASMEDQHLICNGGNGIYLYLDDVKVFLKKIDTEVKENGDEETRTSYKESSISKLEEKLEKEGEVVVNLWLTQQGKVRAIMIVERSFTNNNASLANLEGLDPKSYISSNVMLSINKKGMVLAPINYTEEEKDKFTDFISQYRFAKNVKFYLENVTLTTDDEGKQKKNTQYVKFSYRDMRRASRGTTVHVWLNQYGNISAVLVHVEKEA